MKYYMYLITLLSIAPIIMQSMQNHPNTRGAKRKREELQAIKTLTADQATQQLQAFIKKNRIFPSNPYTLEELNALIGQKADVNTKVNRDTTALMRAAASENIEAMRALIDAGADINISRHGYVETALSCAISHDRPLSVQLLIESGANLASALSHAVRHRPHPNKKIIKLLLDAGADPKTDKEYYGPTAADYVLECSTIKPIYKETWQLFIEKYPELQLPPAQATQELQNLIDSPSASHPCKYENLFRIKRLIALGADVNIKCKPTGIPLFILVTRIENIEIMNALLNAGADINTQTEDQGSTAIMHAIAREAPHVVQFLLDKGADPKIGMKNGKTAVDLAKSEKASQSINDIMKAHM